MNNVPLDVAPGYMFCLHLNRSGLYFASMCIVMSHRVEAEKAGDVFWQVMMLALVLLRISMIAVLLKNCGDPFFRSISLRLQALCD